jgi:hypothetical protein
VSKKAELEKKKRKKERTRVIFEHRRTNRNTTFCKEKKQKAKILGFSSFVVFGVQVLLLLCSRIVRRKVGR